ACWTSGCTMRRVMRSLVVLCFVLVSLLSADSSAELVKSVTIRGSNLRVPFATQVGAPFDNSTVEKDLRALWSTRSFSDIKVETADEPDGVAVVFQVTQAPQLTLHKIEIQPSSFVLQLALPEGTPIDRQRAQRLAGQAQNQLVAEGFRDASVDYELRPFAGKQVDVKLKVDAGERVRVKEVEFMGDSVLDPKELRSALQALKPRRLIPGIPGLWNGIR